mgnify:CR=1 FL=1
MDVKYFTIYWRHGVRQVVKGKTVDEAFNNAGIGAGAVAAVDWYDDGITDTHLFKGQGVWEKKEPLKIKFSDFNKEATPENIQNLCDKLKQKAYLEVEFENQNVLTIEDRYSHFGLGWLRVIVVNFGEYVPCCYNEDTDTQEDEYWMAAGTEYFDPTKPEQAIQAFLERLNKEPFKTSGYQTADLKMLVSSQVF